METKLTKKDYLFIGSMLFGMFFGAGNLIFPVHMGQEAGAAVFQANLGFLVTGIGLPFLGIIAIGLSKSNGLFDLSQRIGPRYAYVFTILLYLVIGPFFALPRLATTSFEIGIAPFLTESQQTIALALFSILFFFFAWWFARKPSKLMTYIGKFLNPIFLVLLGSLLLIAFLKPMGTISTLEIGAAYQNHPFMTGFTQGYNTLDALAALAFGIIVVTTIRQRGVTNARSIALDTVKAGSISILLMGIIYTLLSYLGAMSVGKFPISANGGIALAQISNYYLGVYGSIILAFIVIIACLKTAVGLISAFSETFVTLFPQRSYRFFALVVSVLPCLFANVGLTKIIELSLPVLMFLYPLAITLILLAILSPLFNHATRVYQATSYFTFVAAIFDGLNVAPAHLQQTFPIAQLLAFAKQYLPFFSVGLGWLIPAILGFFLGLLWTVIEKKKHS